MYEMIGEKKNCAILSSQSFNIGKIMQLNAKFITSINRNN